MGCTPAVVELVETKTASAKGIISLAALFFEFRRKYSDPSEAEVLEEGLLGALSARHSSCLVISNFEISRTAASAAVNAVGGTVVASDGRSSRASAFDTFSVFVIFGVNVVATIARLGSFNPCSPSVPFA